MKTETMTKEVKTEQSINLIEGIFTASEASDIINNILNVKINFHKLKVFSRTIGDFNDKCEQDNGRIKALLHEQQIAKEFFKNVRVEGRKLKINSRIEISIED
ncbi:hypothetical protein [Flavicella sediminum]|uniref:hypothetical protein n=1 Tax=Flavicella sediminum TaxID=2585141 RepID=UPI00111CB79B|nr:hypothetical protein [Flavicella sediminum]